MHEEHEKNRLANELHRYRSHTVHFAPRLPNPLPGEREAREAGQPWTIYKILAEIERLKPTIEQQRQEWLAHRQADMPGHLRELQEARAAEAKVRLETAALAPRASRYRDPDKETKSRISLAHLTPAEKRERKLEQTRQSNARRRDGVRAGSKPAYVAEE